MEAQPPLSSLVANNRNPIGSYSSHVLPMRDGAFQNMRPRDVDIRTLEAQAAAAVAESENRDLAYNHRRTSTSSFAFDPARDAQSSHVATQAPLHLNTTGFSNSAQTRTGMDMQDVPNSNRNFGDTGAVVDDSPQAHTSSYPLSPVLERNAGMSQPERLPSFRQLTGQLSELAEAAATKDVRSPSHPVHHSSHSFSSTHSLSPRLHFHAPFPVSNQTSPVGPSISTTVRSPVGSASDIPVYGSPSHQFVSSAYYAQRRKSAAADAPMPRPPQLHSTSSNESHGRSSVDSYSTAQTTPIEGASGSDGNIRSVLSPIHGMSPGVNMMNIGFRCDYPECNAAPFQTQYLLSSHKNVHSQNRPHYCPIQDCPRSEGGKGFKRKNEMIRHGLVHNSPGYICPFCPDREHKYPRPDNLQRHVRVHHVDRDKDDPLLREVLAQRVEGSGKTRRRRTLTGPSSTAPPLIEKAEYANDTFE